MTEQLADPARTPAGTSHLERLRGALHRGTAAAAGERDVALRVVYAGAAAYAAFFIFAAVLHYAVFQTAHVDLGNMVQALWSTLHGHFLEATTPTAHQRDRLGFHVDPFLLLFLPLFWIWSNPLLLQIVQALAVASGALPVFWLARKHLHSSRAGAHFAFAYLLYPATQFNAFTPGAGFHAISIAVPLVLYAVWFLDEDRLLAFSVVALLACTTKEEVPLAIGCLGIWYAVRRGHRAVGAAIFATGLALTLFNFLWVIPHFSPSGSNPFADRYRAVGGTPQGMAHKLFTDPLAFAHAVGTGHKAVYLVLLLVPFLALGLLEPLLLLGAVPDLAINLLSSDANQTTLSFQYTAGILPFLVAASIFGVARIKRRPADLSLWVLTGAAALALYSPAAYLLNDVPALGSPLVAAKAHAVSLVPEGVPVSATNELGGHLAARRYSYTFPYVRQAKWIVIDVNDSTYKDGPGFRRVIREYESDKGWRTVFSSHGIVVLHKGPSSR